MGAQEIEGFGLDLARTHRVFAWALWKWYNANHKALDAIAFDKLCGCVLRLCDSLANQGELTLRIPYRFRRGTHGPGPAIEGPHGQPPRYVGYVLRFMDSQMPGSTMLFTVSTKKRARKIEASDYDLLLFEPGSIDYVIGEWKDDGFFLSRNDHFLVDILTTALGVLSWDEVRALGTHSGVEDTVDAIEFEWPKWDAGLTRMLDGSPSRVKSSYEAAHYPAIEVVRKADMNQEPYKQAYSKVLSNLQASATLGPVLSAFRTEYKPASMIWGDETVRAWARTGKAMEALVEHVYAMGLSYDRQSTLLVCEASASEMNKIRESYASLTDAFPAAADSLSGAQPVDSPVVTWKEFARLARNVKAGIDIQLRPISSTAAPVA